MQPYSIICLNCQKKKRRKARGLCKLCYSIREIRVKFKPEHSGGHEYNEATEEELDAMIAERMKKLPKWWIDDVGNAGYRSK